MDKTPVAQMFEQIVEIDDSSLRDVPEGKQKPVIGSPEWTEYMLSFLTKSEFREHNGKKFPTTAGLQRLCTAKFGKILRSASKLVDPANESNGFTASVEHELMVRPYGEEEVLDVVAVADANERNTDKPYSRFLPPNASTRAFGRCLRDLMQLQICTADELSNVAEQSVNNGDPEDIQPADDAQKAAIKVVSKKLGIDVQKLINYGPFKHRNLDCVLKGTGRAIMSLLNSYQQGAEPPPEIKL